MANQKTLKNCKLQLRKVAPETIGDAEIAAFVDRISALKEAESRKGSKGNFRKAVKEFVDQHRMALAQQRQEKMANVLKNKQAMNYYSTFDEGAGKERGKRLIEAMMSELGGGQQLKKGINDSVSIRKDVRYNDYSSFAYAALAKEGMWDIFESGALEREIMMEMFELRDGGAPGISGSAEAKKIAEVLSALHRRQLNDLKDVGLNIGTIENYIMRQSWDAQKVAAAGAEQFKRDFANALDPDRTFGLDAGDNAKMDEFLDVVFDHITTGKFELPEDLIQTADELITTANYAKLGDQLTKSRQLHFKDGSAFFEINQKYGLANLKQALHRQMRATGRNAAIVEKFGTNPDAAFEARKVRVRRFLKSDPEALAAFDAGMDAVNNLYKQVRGSVNDPVNETMATVSGMVRSYNNIVSLGGTTLRSLPDLMNGIAITSSQTGNGLLESGGKYAQAFMDSVVPSQRRHTAELIGLFIKDHFAEVAQVTGADVIERAPGMMTKISNNFFRLIGLEYWTETTRAAPGLLLSREAAIYSEMKWADLPAQYRANLERYNIDADDWVKITGAVDKLPDGSMAVLGERLNEARKTKLKWAAYLQENAQFSAPQPNDRVRARIIRGTQTGTISGEVHRFIGQFKAFPLFSYDIGLRILASNPDKPLFYYRDALKGKGDFHRLTGWMLGAAVLGYMGDSLLSISKNETPADPTDPWTWKRAFQLSGGAGLYGDILLGEAQRLQQGGLWNQLLGPTASKVSDVAAISSAFVRHTAEGADTTKDELKAFNFIVRQAPGNNIFYLKTAMDQALLDRIREAIDPDYELDKQDRLEKYNKRELLDF